MLPLSLYIHIPWCVKKCPYCDFNSHKSPDTLPEQTYINALISDLQFDLQQFPARELVSVFIGGGTPSLFSADSLNNLLTQIQNLIPFAKAIEITMEANPGTMEQQRFAEYRQAGINRLSLGIQSFNPQHLQRLGRIHDHHQAHKAIETARAAGFNNINLDIMHGLPKQTVAQGLADLTTALSYQPEHLSWYQLTLEPNTVFYTQQPALPTEAVSYALEQQGLQLLQDHKLTRYEVSAFAQSGKQSQHNLNYWLFGDYLGIGAGAHGKYSKDQTIMRTQKYRQPKDYLNPDKPFIAAISTVSEQDLVFEFMLNTSRLEQAIPLNLFNNTTHLDLDLLLPKLLQARDKKLLTLTETHWQVTSLGRKFTNNLQELFLPD